MLATVTLKAGKGGIFKVWLDGDLVFDRQALGRHAEPGEVAATVEQRLGSRLDWR